MNTAQRNASIAAAIACAACYLAYAGIGEPKPADTWHWVDVFSEGGTAVLAGLWGFIVLGSRPDGRVTRLLAGGFAAILVGSWADCMDEFYRVDKAAMWDNALEMLVPFGMVVLTAGLFYWRQEQMHLNDHLRKRERLFRDHNGLDRVTQLADARYLRAQLKHERERGECALVLLDIDGFHRVNREFGQDEGDRVLQAVSHMLLLNLRNEDLLCRYAGDRFAVLLPGVDEGAAQEVATHLCRMVGLMRHHAGGRPVALSMRHGSAQTDHAPDVLLANLCRRMDAA